MTTHKERMNNISGLLTLAFLFEDDPEDETIEFAVESHGFTMEQFRRAKESVRKGKLE